MNPEAFERRLRAATRLECALRVARLLRRILPAVAIAATLCASAVVIHAPGGDVLLRAACLAGLGVLVLIPGWVASRRVSRTGAAQRLDRTLGLPDSALAVVRSSEFGPWGDRIAAAEIPRILGAPGTLRSGQRPLFAWSGLLAVVFLLGVLWRGPEPVPPEPVRPVPEEALEPLKEILNHWEEQPQNKGKTEDREALQALREAIQQRSAGLKEVMVRLARAEDRLQTALQPLKALEALRTAAPSLAKALAGMVPRAAAALERGDFSSAADALRDSAESVEPPSGTEASALDQLARTLGASGLAALADALDQLAQAGSRDQAREATTGLAEALDSAADGMRREQALKQAGMQIQAVREGLGHAGEAGSQDADGIGEEGPGAGGGSGEPKGPVSNSGLETPTGIAPIPGALSGQGASHSESFSTSGGVPEDSSVTPSGVQPVVGDQSSEVVLPESLPPAYRGAVKRYFDILRNPTNAQ